MVAPKRTEAKRGVESPTPAHTIDRTPEYDAFIEKVRIYYQQRGVDHWDPEPKAGQIHIDLLKLYKNIVEKGGYDKVSDLKLEWRKVGSELGLDRQNNQIAAIAFQVKTAYYKNLAAYEISTIHGKEPPPKEILEDLTAKGGSLLTRTLENYKERRSAADDSMADDGTPARERRAEDTPGSGSRAARNLRQDPPQRVIFQPDTNSTRQTRHASTQQHQPQSVAHGQHANAPHHQPQPPRGASSVFNPANMENISPAVNNYEPRPQIALPLRPVDTPSNNPTEFQRRNRLLKAAAQGFAPPGKPAMLPGTGFDGPNIYVRCLNSLRSELPPEQAFALNHLVKITYERGDKYKFESFPGLADGLVEKALEIVPLFYDSEVSISYLLGMSSIGETGRRAIRLDGYNGTRDLLEQLEATPQLGRIDASLPAGFVDRLMQVTEVTLAIRNMMMLPENAMCMSGCMPLQDFLIIALTLPPLEMVVEIKHYALDIAEQLTPYLSIGPQDALYEVLIQQLDTNDRGIILSSLRAIGRVSMIHAETNKLAHFPARVLQHIMNWLLLNDDELMDACLDILYQYTAEVDNVEFMLQVVPMDAFVQHLVRLLSHGAKKVHKEYILEEAQRTPSTEDVVPIPQDLLEQLVALEEPDRCFQWLKCFFEEDEEGFITQITIWQAYQSAFLAALQSAGRVIIGAAEFIRNVSTVFSSASAQVLREQGIQKFIIKGIRARKYPLALDGHEYVQCLWTVSPDRSGRLWLQYFSDAEKMWYHIINSQYPGIPPPEGGKFHNNRTQPYVCHWQFCKKYPVPTTMSFAQFAAHVKVHCQQAEQSRKPPQNGDYPAGAKRRRRDYITPAKTMTLTFEETTTVRDEKNPTAPAQAAGIPLSAALILRNIARNVVKTASEEANESKMSGDGSYWIDFLFTTVKPRIQEVYVQNRALAPHMLSLVEILDRYS